MFIYTSHSPCSNQCLHFIRALNPVPTLAFCRASEDVRGTGKLHRKELCNLEYGTIDGKSIL
jgi:hypothetical protein